MGELLKERPRAKADGAASFCGSPRVAGSALLSPATVSLLPTRQAAIYMSSLLPFLAPTQVVSSRSQAHFSFLKHLIIISPGKRERGYISSPWFTHRTML